MATAVVDEQPQDLPTAALSYKRVTFVNRLDSTAGLRSTQGGDREMSTWRPNLETGWYFLGQGVTGIFEFGGPSGVIVHALEDDALKDVASWERVWTDEGSPNPKDYALWRGVPPSADYAVIGGIFCRNPNYAAPDSAQTYGIKAIRRDLLIVDTLFQVWEDDSRAHKEASVWITLGLTGVKTGAMIPNSSHNQPPEDVGLSLDSTKILEIAASNEGDATTSESADK